MSFTKFALGAIGLVAAGYGVKKWLDSEMEKAGYDGEIFGYQDVIADKLNEAAEGLCDRLDNAAERLETLKEMIEAITTPCPEPFIIRDTMDIASEDRVKEEQPCRS